VENFCQRSAKLSGLRNPTSTRRPDAVSWFATLTISLLGRFGAYTPPRSGHSGLDPNMTEPKTGLASLELKDAVRLRWTLYDIKSQRTKIVPVSPDDLRILIDMGLVEMWCDVPVVTCAGNAEIS
jgi:hypothetical protein